MSIRLFSMFDPCSTYNEWAWIMSVIPPLFIVPKVWAIGTSVFKPVNLILVFLTQELILILKSQVTFLINQFYVVFFFLILANLLSLFPYVFPCTSHLNVGLIIGLHLWVPALLMSLFYSYKNLLSHLVPSGTPQLLLHFIVLIEFLSLIIRPFTLSVRLIANITAGHLILGLLSRNLPFISLMPSIPLFLSQLILSFLEFIVAVIQAYVFTVLLALYLADFK